MLTIHKLEGLFSVRICLRPTYPIVTSCYFPSRLDQASLSSCQFSPSTISLIWSYPIALICRSLHCRSLPFRYIYPLDRSRKCTPDNGLPGFSAQFESHLRYTLFKSHSFVPGLLSGFDSSLLFIFGSRSCPLL